MRDFRKYDVWKLSHEIALEIYKLSLTFPKEEKYNITSQLRRSSLSVPTNISEGCGRSSDADFNRFLQISLGSAHEVEYLLQFCFDLKIIEEIIYIDLDKRINLIKQKLYHLSQKLLKN
jgi:four helix bundle protein